MLEVVMEVGGSVERAMLVLKTWSVVGEWVSKSAVMKVMLSEEMELVGGSILVGSCGLVLVLAMDVLVTRCCVIMVVV